MPTHEVRFGERYVECICGKWRVSIAAFGTEWPKHFAKVAKQEGTCPPDSHEWEIALVHNEFAYYRCRNCVARKQERRWT